MKSTSRIGARRIVALSLMAFLLTTMQACSPTNIQHGLTTLFNILQNEAPVAVQFVTLEHNAGNISDDAFARFLNAKSVFDRTLPIFQSGIAGAKDAKGAVALVNALVPSVNAFIASGLAFKNPQAVAKATAWAQGFALVFNAATAIWGSRTPVVVSSSVSAELIDQREFKDSVRYHRAQIPADYAQSFADAF